MKLKRTFLTVVSCYMICGSAWTAEFNNKFSLWWTHKYKTMAGKIKTEKPSFKAPQGYLDFVPVAGKYSIQAYHHIKINNKKCYKLTLKLKSSADIDSKTIVIFSIAAKDKAKSWTSLKPTLRKEIQLEPGQSQTVSFIVDLSEMNAEKIVFLIPTVTVGGLQKGKITLESLTCESIKAPISKKAQKLSNAVALLPGYKLCHAAMPKTKWSGGSKGMRKMFNHIPLNISVFKLLPKKKEFGFQWPDKRILLIKPQGDVWVVYSGKADKLEEFIRIKADASLQLVFYGTGIFVHKNEKLLATVDYGINNLNVHLFSPLNSSDIKFDNINIRDAFLQWRYLAFAEKNLLESEKLFKDNQKYIISSYRDKQYMVSNWEMNFKTLRTQIAVKRKNIISQTWGGLPLLTQIPNVNDGYSTIIQYAGLMSIKHGYLGTYFQKNWFKSFSGMPSYQYSVDLKNRCVRLAARAWHLGDVAFKNGHAIKQNDTNILAAGFTNSLATVFKHRNFLGEYSKSFLLKLSKGEYESCQLILRTGTQDVKNISIEIGNISGPGTISKEQCRFYLMRYLRLAEPYNINTPVTGGGNTYWPDPLRQWENNKEFSIPAQSNQVLWLTLQAPENAVAGEYKFDVKVKLKGAVVAQLPVQFKVFDFALGKNRLMDASGLRFGTIKQFYGNSAEARLNCEKVLLEHYCNPIEIYNKSPNYEDVKACIKNGMNMLALDRFETLAAPRKGMTKFVKLYASNDGIKFKRIHAKVKLVPQVGDIDLVDWDLVITPKSSLKDYKYIKLHNSETRGWSNRCGRRFFLINMTDGVLLNGEDKAKNIKYYMMDKVPTVTGGAKLIEKPSYFEFDDVRLNKGRASILIKKESGAVANEIRLIGCKRSIYIPRMKKAYKKFRELCGEKFPIMSFGFDEVGEQENPEVLSALKTCKKLFPDVVTVTTATGIKKMPECYKYLDYMCPVNCRFFNNIEKSLNDKYGTKSWIYVGGGANYPYPSFERLDQPRINSRAFFWVCAKYDIKGWLYWAVNMWRFNAKVTKKWPEIWDEWDPSYSFTTNGMGALMYPGPNNTAMPSARLEAMRDGIEDYNYFKIAEEMLKARKFNNAEQRKEIADFVEKAKHILSPGFSGFLEKTDEFNKLRDKLASFIEKMNKLPLK